VLEDELPDADIAVANIELATVEALAPRVRARILVTSGYPGREWPSLAGWEHGRRAERDGWAADLHRRE
jgi:hypothetical protein